MSLTDRMIQAVRADVALYEEVERDSRATIDAVVIVAGVSFALGVGAALNNLFAREPISVLFGLALGMVGGLISWTVLAGMTFLIGTEFLGAKVTWGAVLRTLGYAATPLLAAVLAFIPYAGAVVVAAATLWCVYLVFIAIRSALDISSAQAVATIFLCFVPAFLINALVYRTAIQVR